MRIVAITACPTGIAHTYMAAEKLSRAGDERGHHVRVETHGSIGVEDELTAEEIEAADAVVIAADQDVDTARFAGKPLISVSVAAAIKDPEGLIERALATPPPEEPAAAGGPKTPSQKAKERSLVYRNLMNGVSYMIPFVVVGGLLIAVSLAVAGDTTPDGLKIPEDSFWFKVNEVGAAAFQFMVPILAGYIAFAIADRPGLAPGVIGGYVAATGSFYDSEAGTGFIGGIIAGFLAGYVARWIRSWRVPDMLKPIMPILVIPILSTLVVAALFIWVIGRPIGGLMEDLTGVLGDMQGSSRLVLGGVLGAMIAFDMGGPVNKVAFLFGAGLIAQGEYAVMGACAVAICVPPLGLGVATLIRRDRFTGEEHEAGKAALAMGLVGITEGAIPFAAADPLRVIPANVAGGVVGGAIAATAGVLDHVPHGGPVVAVLGAIGGVPMFLVAALAGIAVTAAAVLVLKKPIPRADRQAEAA